MRPRPRATTADGHKPTVLAAPDVEPHAMTIATTNAARPVGARGAAGTAHAPGHGDEHRAGGRDLAAALAQPRCPRTALARATSQQPQLRDYPSVRFGGRCLDR